MAKKVNKFAEKGRESQLSVIFEFVQYAQNRRIWSGEDNGAKRIETAERKRGNPRKTWRFEKLRY